MGEQRDRDGSRSRRPGDGSASKRGSKPRNSGARPDRPSRGRDSGRPDAQKRGRPARRDDRRPGGASQAGSTGRRPEPRTQEGSQGQTDDRPRRDRPPIPEDVSGKELERFILAELRTLSEDKAELAAKYLVMVGRLSEEDPEEAVRYAKAARELAPRVALLRETYGTAAYAVGDYATAATELRAARRISGSDEFLALIADCERGLGRPERALSVVGEVSGRIPSDLAVELLLVEAGARRDLGDVEAAVVTLQRPELRSTKPTLWLARLRYAYADALLAAGRTAQARRWFGLAAAVDAEGLTEAAERLDEIDGTLFEELEELEELEEVVEVIGVAETDGGDVDGIGEEAAQEVHTDEEPVATTSDSAVQTAGHDASSEATTG